MPKNILELIDPTNPRDALDTPVGLTLSNLEAIQWHEMAELQRVLRSGIIPHEPAPKYLEHLKANYFDRVGQTLHAHTMSRLFLLKDTIQKGNISKVEEAPPSNGIEQVALYIDPPSKPYYRLAPHIRVLLCTNTRQDVPADE
jgi:hypothetical protein